MIVYIEHLWMDLKINEFTFIVGAIYIPGGTLYRFLTAFKEALSCVISLQQFINKPTRTT